MRGSLCECRVYGTVSACLCVLGARGAVCVQRVRVCCLRTNNEGHFDQCASQHVALAHLQQRLPLLIPLRAGDTASLHLASHPLLTAATGPSPETTQFPKRRAEEDLSKMEAKVSPEYCLAKPVFCFFAIQNRRSTAAASMSKFCSPPASQGPHVLLQLHQTCPTVQRPLHLQCHGQGSTSPLISLASPTSSALKMKQPSGNCSLRLPPCCRHVRHRSPSCLSGESRWPWGKVGHASSMARRRDCCMTEK